MQQIKTIIIGSLGSSMAFGSVAVSVEARIEAWLRLLTMVVGLVSALVTIYWLNRMSRVNLAKAESDLCQSCRKGFPPQECPLPDFDRPEDCPYKKGLPTAKKKTFLFGWLLTKLRKNNSK